MYIRPRFRWVVFLTRYASIGSLKICRICICNVCQVVKLLCVQQWNFFHRGAYLRTRLRDRFMLVFQIRFVVFCKYCYVGLQNMQQLLFSCIVGERIIILLANLKLSVVTRQAYMAVARFNLQVHISEVWKGWFQCFSRGLLVFVGNLQTRSVEFKGYSKGSEITLPRRKALCNCRKDEHSI